MEKANQSIKEYAKILKDDETKRKHEPEDRKKNKNRTNTKNRKETEAVRKREKRLSELWSKELESRTQMSREWRVNVEIAERKDTSKGYAVANRYIGYWTTYDSNQSTEEKQNEWPKIQFISAIHKINNESKFLEHQNKNQWEIHGRFYN